MTKFALIAAYQVWENYAAHEWDGTGACPQYWKAKGSEEVVVRAQMTLDEVLSLSSKEIMKMVEDAAPTDDEFFFHDLIDYELVELSNSLVEDVKDFMSSDKFDAVLHNDARGISFDMNIPEYAVRWALGQC